MAIYLIVLMCTLNHAGFGGSRVAVSLYALELGANQFAIGVLMALYGLCPMLLAVSIGKLADTVGHHGGIRGARASTALSRTRDAVPLGAVDRHGISSLFCRFYPFI